MLFTLRQAQSYLDDIDHLPKDVRELKLPRSQRQLSEDPFQPGLRSHPFQAIKKKKAFRSDVDQHYRIVWWYGENDRSIILWRVGIHKVVDALDSLDKIPKLIIAKEVNYGSTGLSEKANQASEKVEATPLKGKGIFAGISPVHLQIIGVPEDLVEEIRQVVTFDEIPRSRLPNRAYQILSDYYTNPDWTPDNILDIRQTMYRSSVDQLEDYCKGRIQRLMLDLSTEQEKIVETQAEGTLLVKGVAGSGKTTVGVYRTLHLAKNRRLFSTKPILFLTYSETLARVVKEMFTELTPKDQHADLPEQINASTMRDWCLEYLKSGEKEYKQETARNYLNKAMAERIPKDASYEFLKKEYFIPTEIGQVIKGRGVASWEEYKSIKRVGRGQPLSERPRQLIWDVYCDYQKRLLAAGVMDEDDLFIEALKSLNSDPSFEPYPEVVVDEAQDMTPKALELAAKLAGSGKSFGLCLLADPAQSIYYRGISWRDGNIEIHSSRVKTLRKNFRNTKPILEAAWALSKAIPEDALSEVIEPERTDRPGMKPQIIFTGDQSDQDLKCLKDLILRYHSANYYRFSDFAVLCATREKSRAVASYLKNAGFPVSHFRENDFNVFENNIKVITIHSAKGLEFPIVIIMNVDEGVIPRKFNHIQDEDDVKVFLKGERQLLYVGMTRAAEGLFMLVTSGKGSRFLKDIPADMVDVKECVD